MSLICLSMVSIKGKILNMFLAIWIVVLYFKFCTEIVKKKYVERKLIRKFQIKNPCKFS